MTTVASFLSCSVENGVAAITLNHPPVNMLTPQLLNELEMTLDGLAADEQVKVVTITGAGRVFIAGADINVIASIRSAEEGTELARRGQAVLNKIEASDKPVIAAINGMCLGGGLELALCCHLRIAADAARLGQPEINLGIMPGFGGTQRLPRLIGRAKALELMLTGEPLSATEAKAIGLVSHVVPADDLLRQTQGLARKIASKGQLAVRAVLRAVRKASSLPLPDGLALEARLFGDICETQDKQEGVAAFLEKRHPKFSNQ
jgi:enoyl-CoA hydratase/carnithine racemase